MSKPSKRAGAPVLDVILPDEMFAAGGAALQLSAAVHWNLPDREAQELAGDVFAAMIQAYLFHPQSRELRVGNPPNFGNFAPLFSISYDL